MIRVPGKIMLCGEYSCLFGGKALSFAINRYLMVTKRPQTDIFSVYSDLLRKTFQWEPGKAGHTVLEHTMGHLVKEYGLRPCHMEIYSELDPCFGFGSSSALRLGMTQAYGEENPMHLAYQMQKDFQSEASGYDVLTQSQGGLLVFQREESWPGNYRKYTEINEGFLSQNLTVLVGGKGAPTGALIRQTYPRLKGDEDFKRVSDELVDLFLSCLLSDLKDLSPLIRKIAEHQVFFHGTKSFPEDLFRGLEQLKGFGQSWTLKTTGSGGEDALLLIGDKKHTEGCLRFLLEKSWYPIDVKMEVL